MPQSRHGDGRGIKGSWKSRRRKRGGKRPNSFLSVVRFNFPRFASEPFNALQPAPLPIHFLVPFPISAAIKGPRCRSRICEEIDRASIYVRYLQPIVLRESCRNEASETRYSTLHQFKRYRQFHQTRRRQKIECVHSRNCNYATAKVY